MLDIALFRADKGGDPEKVRASQRARGGSVEVVDEIIALDKQWISRTARRGGRRWGRPRSYRPDMRGADAT